MSEIGLDVLRYPWDVGDTIGDIRFLISPMLLELGFVLLIP